MPPMTPEGLKHAIGRLARVRFLFVFLINLIPVGGVVFLSWDAGAILILYWIENVIIGALTLPRIVMAQGAVPHRQGGQRESRAGLGCFFVIHYGIFTLVHGVITLVLAARFVTEDAVGLQGDLGWAVAATAILHGVAFFRDWIRPRKWLTASPAFEMMRPYGRIFVLHITIILGAWGLSELSAPTWTVLVLCLLKAVLELIIDALGRAGRRPG
jgi:hypothetical protein